MMNGFSGETIDRVLKTIIKLLKLNYVLPDKVEALTMELESLHQRGHYRDVREPMVFADRLTGDLFQLTSDGHLAVDYNPDLVRRLKQYQNADLQEDSIPLTSDHGFKTIQCLSGNIGYLELTDFSSASLTGNIAGAAFEILSTCDALLIDLRQNYGGEVSMVQLLATYLLDHEPHLLHLYSDPRTEFQQQIWTLPFVPGKRLTDIPVYVLVSQNTYSAAEEFTYDLQAMGRIIVVGERTGGGAHLTETHVAGSDFVVQIPVAQIINPITGTNWQGRGIAPDIPTSSQKSLPTAHLHALEMLLKDDGTEIEKARRIWDIETVKATYHPFPVSHQQLLSYVGKYGEWIVQLEDSHLTLNYQHTRTTLLPISITEFASGEGMRIEFVLESGAVSAIVVHYRNHSKTITLHKL